MHRSSEWKKIWEKRTFDKDVSLLYASGFEMMSDDDWDRMVGCFLKVIDYNDAKKIVDIGCGSGAFLNAIKKKIPSIGLSGCDISSSSIDIASSRLEGEFKISDASVTIDSFVESFDIVSSFSVFQYFDSYNMARIVLKNMLSYIRGDGVLFVGDIPDLSVKNDDIKQRDSDGRKKSDHFYYGREFFTFFALDNKLSMKLYYHDEMELPVSFPNKKFRYSIIMRKQNE